MEAGSEAIFGVVIELNFSLLDEYNYPKKLKDIKIAGYTVIRYSVCGEPHLVAVSH